MPPIPNAGPVDEHIDGGGHIEDGLPQPVLPLMSEEKPIQSYGEHGVGAAQVLAQLCNVLECLLAPRRPARERHELREAQLRRAKQLRELALPYVV